MPADDHPMFLKYLSVSVISSWAEDSSSAAPDFRLVNMNGGGCRLKGRGIVLRWRIWDKGSSCKPFCQLGNAPESLVSMMKEKPQRILGSNNIGNDIGQKKSRFFIIGEILSDWESIPCLLISVQQHYRLAWFSTYPRWNDGK